MWVNLIVSLSFQLSITPKKRMDYLQEKWKVWYQSLDVNHDGKISYDDVEESRKKFTELHRLLGNKAADVEKNMEIWWKKYIFRQTIEEISESDFVKLLSDDYNKDKTVFKKEMTDCFNMIFDVIDTNKDRCISLEEFIFAFKAFGHENEELLRRSFDAYNPDKEHQVPLWQIVQSWVEFVADEDRKKPNAVKHAFDAAL